MRSAVIWHGKAPKGGAVTCFSQRNLSIKTRDSVKDDEVVSARSAIFHLGDHANDDVIERFNRDAEMFIDFGVQVQVVATSDAALGELQASCNGKLQLPGVTIGTGHKGHVIAERAARQPVDPLPRLNLDIVLANNRPPLTDEDTRLIQRAFHDCSKIVLVEMTGGMSEARVFAAHMTVDISDAGRFPQPAFVKIDRLDKIEREHQNYRKYADRFVPFGLRPNVHGTINGHSRGLLRGDFVDKSESLWDLVRRNVAANAIASLFANTLSGWRDQAYTKDEKMGSVAEAMGAAGIVRPYQIKERYVERAASEGIAMTADEAWRILSDLPQKYREAPCHGDLHGENVRVQGSQAILIDMASVAAAPLTADIAALETWLAFQVPPESKTDEWADDAWRQEIERLYDPAAFAHPPGPITATDDLCWMATAVRQLRHLGLAAQSCPTEYQAAVAVQLLRRCQWDDGSTHDIYRRGIGYMIGARLIEDLKAKFAYD